MSGVYSVYADRARHMILNERDRQRFTWSFEHDLAHTEEEWEALILKHALEHRWTAVGALALAAQEARIARPIEALDQRLADMDAAEGRKLDEWREKADRELDAADEGR